MDRMNLPSSTSETDIETWKSIQHDLWFGIPAKLKGKVIIEPAKEGMRDLISSKWDINNGSHANTHWAIIELAGKTTDIEYLIEILGNLGITRETQGIFNQYCEHLEKMPKIVTSSTIHNSRSDTPISKTSKGVASRIFDALLAMVVPHSRKN